MNRMILPSADWTSFRTAFRRSSNSPRNFAPGDQRAHVERDDLLVLQALGHVAADDALGQAFDDGRLADARLADQHRIVLGAPRQHLDHAPDLFVAPDHRIELALRRQLGQIAAVFFERFVGRLGILRGHALRPANFLQRPHQPLAVMPRSLKTFSSVAASRTCSTEM